MSALALRERKENLHDKRGKYGKIHEEIFWMLSKKKDTKENKLGSIITTAAMVVSQFVNIHEIIHTHQPSRAVL